MSGHGMIPPAEFSVLIALLDGEKHGHAIKLEVRDRTGGEVVMSPGTLYGAIKRLVDRGWIAEVASPSREAVDERRRYYAITELGRAAAADEAGRMRQWLEIGRSKGLAPAAGS